MLRLRYGVLLSAAFVCACFAAASACLPGGGPALIDGDDAGSSSIGLDDGSFTKSDVDLGDPFALQGLSPSHGPFTGGTRAALSGRGFTSKIHVFLGGTEVPPASVLASDPTRAAIVTPPGPPGFVDVRIHDDVTAKDRLLPKGFFYDAFVVQPDSGATSGGTRIALTGSGTTWQTVGTKVAIGGVACNEVVVSAPTKLECITPAGAPGSKDVTVTTPDGKSIQARDAFTYSDSPDGYRGGLSGGAFSGTVRVLAFDSLTGTPIGGAKAIAGSSLATAVVQMTSASGVTEFDGLTGSKVTITVAAKCHQPVSYVDVPVDTVTIYLDPILDPSCAMGDPPSTGGGGGKFGGIVAGQLIFPGGAEFMRNGWSTVPGPTRPTERRAAYVFEAGGAASDGFQLPDASQAITPDSPGDTGYTFEIVTFPGNVTLYVVAGLEDRTQSPPRFVPYSMGVARGISVPTQTRVTGVDVKMDILFDHQVTVAPQPPPAGNRGPDRFGSTLAVTLGSAGYAILPNGAQIVPYPVPASVPFIGVPSLDHGIAGEQYVLGGIAASGSELQVPASIVSRVRTTNANDAVVLGGFLGVPVLAEPAGGAWGGTHVQFTGASGPVDLEVITIVSGGGLVTWTIAAPGGVTSFDLPDLAALNSPDHISLLNGPISTTVHVARIESFTYGRIRQGQLGPASWNAHALDSLTGAY